MKWFNFSPAVPENDFLFRACRPGHPAYAPGTGILDWLTFVDEIKVKRVCCLLDEQQLDQYDGLLRVYHDHFGGGRVCHAPIPDFTVATPNLYHKRLPRFSVTPWLKMNELSSTVRLGRVERDTFLRSGWLISAGSALPVR
jgi:hypothetical protein